MFGKRWEFISILQPWGINGIHALNQRYEARMGFQINGIHAVWHEPGHEPGFNGVVIHSFHSFHSFHSNVLKIMPLEPA